MFYLEKRNKKYGRSEELIRWDSYGFIQKWFEKRLGRTFYIRLETECVSKADLQRLTIDCLEVLEDAKKAKELFQVDNRRALSFVEEIKRTSRKLRKIIEEDVDWLQEECSVYRY